jgi:hypothetical protein
MENLTAPFQSEASLHTYTINPDIKGDRLLHERILP